MAFDEDAYFLKIGQEFTHCPTAYFAAGSTLTFILTFPGDEFPGEFTFSANSTFF